MSFWKKKAQPARNNEARDIWGREPLKLYEKFGHTLDRSEDNLLRTVNGEPILNFMVLFDQGKPDIRGIGALVFAGEWIDYGSKLYRVNTVLSEVALKELIAEELHLQPEDFLVTSTKTNLFFWGAF